MKAVLQIGFHRFIVKDIAKAAKVVELLSNSEQVQEEWDSKLYAERGGHRYIPTKREVIELVTVTDAQIGAAKKGSAK